MTETARRLHQLGAPHARARALAVVLAGLGVALAAAALGLVLAPAVPGVTISWVLIALSVAAAVWAVLRVRGEAAAAPIGRLVESATRGRAGSVVGVVSPSINKGQGTSAALLLAADTRAAAFVSFAAPQVNATLRRTTRRRLVAGAGTALLGAVLFVCGALCMANKRNAIGVLMGVELVLNGANINFVAFARFNPTFEVEGQIFALFIIVLAAAEVDGAVVCLGDMPLVSAAAIDRLIGAFNPVEGRAICVPTRRGKRGNPVLLARQLFPELAAVSGDIGARDLVTAHPELVAEVEMESDGVLTDIDTPQALAKLAATAKIDA